MTRISIFLLAAAVAGGVAMQPGWSAVAQTPAAPAPPAKPSPGCTWLGVRVVQSLIRDDLVAAGDFQRLYQSFGCPQQQLRITLDCVVKYGTPIAPGQVQELVNACWDRPTQPVIPAPGPQRLDKPQPEKPKTDKK
ncbi:MAG: hypothetical protein HYW28_10555 [Rhodospirillales bacterium]|nr:hypothetical protein [Rhodospirillales bacterium]